MTTASIAIAKRASTGDFTLRLEFPDRSDAMAGLTPRFGEAPAVMLDRVIGREGYRRVKDWQYDVAEGYLVGEIEPVDVSASGLCEVDPDGVTCIGAAETHRGIYHGGQPVPGYAS